MDITLSSEFLASLLNEGKEAEFVAQLQKGEEGEEPQPVSPQEQQDIIKGLYAKRVKDIRSKANGNFRDGRNQVANEIKALIQEQVPEYEAEGNGKQYWEGALEHLKANVKPGKETIIEKTIEVELTDDNSTLR